MPRLFTDAEEIADIWVTPMRLTHVLDAFPDASMEQMGDIIKAMVADVMREGADEVADTKEVRRAISAATAKLFKQRMKDGLREG